MDRRIGWYQPEQQGPATSLWTKILNNSALSFQQLQVSENMNGANKIRNGRAPDYISLISDNSRYGFIVDEKTNNNPYAGRKDNLASTYDWNNTGSKDNGTPWRIQGKVYEEGVVGLHQEIEDFHRFMYPRPEEHLMRTEVVERVSVVVRSIWPEAKVEIYGSCKTWLYLPTSDIDLVVFGELGTSPWFKLAEELEKSEIVEPGSMKVLNGAAIPIVKLTDRFTRVSVDISFNVEGTQACVNIIENFMKEYPTLPILTIILKQFLLQRYLNEVFYGGISSYSLILLIVSFLQLHVPPEPQNFGVMLIEFFELYGVNFNYFKTYISLEEGGSYHPKDNQTYNLLSIVDPIYPDAYPEFDAGKSCHGIMEVRKAFHYAYLVLSQAVLPHLDQGTNGNSILGRIIRVTDEVISHRLWIQRMWGPKVYAMPFPFRLPNSILEQRPVPIIMPQAEDTAFRIAQTNKSLQGAKNNNNDEMCVNENQPLESEMQGLTTGGVNSAMPPSDVPQRNQMTRTSTASTVSLSSWSSSSSADVPSSSSDSESEFSSQTSGSGSSKEIVVNSNPVSSNSASSTEHRSVTIGSKEAIKTVNEDKSTTQCNVDKNRTARLSPASKGEARHFDNSPSKSPDKYPSPRTSAMPHIQVTLTSVQKSEIQTSLHIPVRDTTKSSAQRNPTNQTVTSRTYHNRNLNYHSSPNGTHKYKGSSNSPGQSSNGNNGGDGGDSNGATPLPNQLAGNKRFKRTRHKKEGNGSRRPSKY